MTQGLKEGEPNGRDVYPDIIDHPHWKSPTRPHMSLYDRAAQFSAFDALAGYTDMVREEQRETASQVDLSDNALEKLNQKLSLIADVTADGEHPSLSFTVFVPDKRKAGGSYETITDSVKRIDTVQREVVLMTTEGRGQTNKAIDFDKIISITGDLVDYLDDVVD